MAANETGPLAESTGADTGFTTDFGVALPGSPADAMGTTPLPPSGGVGAADPADDAALQGDDQVHDRGIIEEGSPPASGALKSRLVDDVEPGTSNISGPTPFEEGRDR
jgi:hypothetical protein